jgi:hypothetical protein
MLLSSFSGDGGRELEIGREGGIGLAIWAAFSSTSTVAITPL